jgi:DNA-binding CsgD family transcriptional regulator/PAS domain-containing protein
MPTASRELERPAARPPSRASAIRPLAPVDEIIGLIYRGPLEVTPWRSFLKALRSRMDCDFAAIMARPGRIGATPLMVMEAGVMVDEEEARGIATEHARLAHLDPLAAALVKPGDIFTLDEVMSWERYAGTEFYTAVIRPYGIRDQLGMFFSEPGGWKCNVGLMNLEGRPRFGAAEKQFFLSFLPHLQASLEIYARMTRDESEKRIFEETLERLTIGTFILDGAGQVIDTNRVGRTIVRESNAISVVGGRLVLARADESAHLNNSIRQAIEWRERRTPEAFVDALSVESREGTSLGIVIRAVSSTDRFESDFNPRVIVYVGDSTHQHLAPERFVARLFGLTPTEALLATLLANGLTLTEAAAKLGVTENTIRSYAKRIFAKVGVSRQTELVRLILTSVALLA